MRRKDPELRRSSILDAADRLLLDKPAHEITIDDITAAAGVAKGTFYLYFRSKSALLASLRARLAQDLLDEHARSLATIPLSDHARRMDTWIRDAIEGRVRRAKLHDALFHAGHGGNRSAYARSHIAMLAELLAEGRAAGQFDVGDPMVLATLLYNAMHGAVDDLLYNNHPDADELIRTVQQLARRAVDARPVRARGRMVRPRSTVLDS